MPRQRKFEDLPKSSAGIYALRARPFLRRRGSSDYGDRSAAPARFEAVNAAVNKYNGVADETSKAPGTFDYCRLCNLTGDIQGDCTKAHVIPHKDGHTADLELWCIALRLLSGNVEQRKRQKMLETNLIRLSHKLSTQMEPQKCGFVFAPTRATLISIIQLSEARLRRAERSTTSFYGYDALQDLLSDWSQMLPVDEEFPLHVKVYDYTPMIFFDRGRHSIITRCLASDGASIEETSHRPVLLNLTNNTQPVNFPARVEPSLPTRHLALDPFIVTLACWKCIQEIKRKGFQGKRVNFSQETMDTERLCDYLLRLLEVDTPIAYRSLDRPNDLLDFSLPAAPRHPNRTHRFVQEEHAMTLAGPSGKRYPSDGSSNSAKRSIAEDNAASSSGSSPTKRVTRASMASTEKSTVAVDAVRKKGEAEEEQGPNGTPPLGSPHTDQSSDDEEEELPEEEEEAGEAAGQEVLSIVRQRENSRSSKTPSSAASSLDILHVETEIGLVAEQLEQERAKIAREAFGDDFVITSARLYALRASHDEQLIARMVSLHAEQDRLMERRADLLERSADSDSTRSTPFSSDGDVRMYGY